MENQEWPEGLKVVGTWDNASPAGVPYQDHFMSLTLNMVQVYFQAGMNGVFLVHPMVASMLSIVDPLHFGEFEWDGPTEQPIKAGRVGGVQVWVEPHIRPDEVLVTDGPEDLQPRGRINIINFVSPVLTGPLERLAGIE